LAIRLFDSLIRKKLDFEPRQAPRVGLYVCGVTVYDLCHLGHARTYCVWDTVQRHLRARGFDVLFVRNITDVDDKIIRRAAEQGVDFQSVVERNVTEMYRDFDALGLAKPDVEPRATTHIPEMIAHIRALIAKGAAYESAGDVYFAVDSFAEYGALSGQSLDELQAGARVEPGEKKKNPLDFALWKAAKPGEPFWESPWGNGRPGWHIECSAMSAKYLGGSFDIHTGGRDLTFPHHQNEIAQSQAVTGPGTFSKYWMHNGFVNLNAEKMSKSTGNFFTIREVLKHHDAEALRLYLLSVHYRSPINVEVEERNGRPNFTGVGEAEKRLDYLYTALARLDDQLAIGKDAGPGELMPEVAGFVQAFGEAMDDDFNTAIGLAVLGESATLANRLVDDPKSAPKDVRRRTMAALRKELPAMAGVLGLLGRAPVAYQAARRTRLAELRGIHEADIDAQVEQRNQLRRNKDFAAADGVRHALAERGIEVMDTPTGTRWRFTG
jgi:cysteinyl-tRNA synthetase